MTYLTSNIYAETEAMSVEEMKAICETDEEKWSNPIHMEIILDNFKYIPEDIVFKKCQAYHLVLTNKSNISHTFTAKEFFESVLYKGDSGEIDVMTDDDMDKLDLKGRQASTLEFMPAVVGKYPLKCTHFGHAFRGMKGSIIVEE